MTLKVGGRRAELTHVTNAHTDGDTWDLLHGWLLRARRERPGCRAAEKGDELPPLHSMTSVASARRVCGMVRRSL